MATSIFCPNLVPKTSLFSISTNLSRPSRSPPRSVVAATDFSGGGYSYWTALNSDIQNHLQRTIVVKPPLSVHEPLRYFALTPPPHDDVAAALCVASYELFGGQNRDKAVEVAAALRLLYAVSYTHQPFLNATSETVHDEPYGENLRLLIGDGLVPLAIEILTRPEDSATVDPGRVLQVIIEATNAIGSQGLVQGQYRELLRRKSPADEGHVEGIFEMSEKIDGKVHGCSAACGAILGGGNKDEIDKLRSFGVNVGKIKGVLRRWRREGRDKGVILKNVEKMKDLAMKELVSFQGDKVNVMYGLIDMYLKEQA